MSTLWGYASFYHHSSGVILKSHPKANVESIMEISERDGYMIYYSLYIKRIWGLSCLFPGVEKIGLGIAQSIIANNWCCDYTVSFGDF